jgi:hypothetical protein
MTFSKRNRRQGGWLEERRFAIDACTMPAYSRIRRASKAVRFQGIAVGH